MPPLPLLTVALAERIERSVPQGKIEQYDVEVERFGQTFALRGAGPSRQWLNGVYCFGAPDLGRLNDIVEFYRASGPPAFYMAPIRFTSEVGKALSAAGLHQTGFTQAMLYGAPSAGTAPPTEGITIEPVTAATVETFGETTAQGFQWPAAWRDGAKAGMVRRFGAANFHPFLARCDGTPAGAGAIEVHDGAASLIHGAVVPEFRGRGVQLALIHHRLRAAPQLGCDLIIGGADFGSASFRNQLRAGLGVAYVESTWTRR